MSPSPDDPAALPGWAFGIGLAAAADWLEKKKKKQDKKSDFILLFTVFVSGEEGRGGVGIDRVNLVYELLHV